VTRIVRVAVSALGLLAAGLLVPGIEIEWSDEVSGVVITLVTLALVFGVVNAFVRPIGRLVAIPLNLLTLGLFSLVLNAFLLLLVAAVLDFVGQPILHIGSFPPDISIDAVGTAALGAFIISVVSTSMNLLIPDT
jgi:putative membrane protein